MWSLVFVIAMTMSDGQTMSDNFIYSTPFVDQTSCLIARVNIHKEVTEIHPDLKVFSTCRFFPIS